MTTKDMSLDKSQLSTIQKDLSASIPHSWVLTTLGEPFKWSSGGTPKSDNPQFYDGDIPWLVIGDLNDDIVYESAAKITEMGLKSSAAKLVSAGAIMLAMYGSIGKLGIAGRSLATNQAIAFTKTNEINHLYLFYFLKFIRNRLARLGKGATQQNISQTVIKAFPFVLAPKQEQHRIVAKIEELFTELDRGAESLKTAQAQLKVYRQALLKHAFEGKLTEQWRAENPDKLESAEDLLKRIQTEREQRYEQQLSEWEASGKQGRKPKAPKDLPPLTTEELAELPELPEGWKWAKSGELFESVTSGSRGWAKYYADSGAIFIRITNLDFDTLNLDLNAEKVQFVKPPAGTEGLRTRIKEGDFLFSITGDLGMFAIAPSLDEAYVNQHISLARPLDGFHEKFFGYYTISRTGGIHYLSKLTKGAVKAGLGLDDIRNLPVPMCSQEEQVQISNQLELRLSEADHLDQTITTALQQAESLRQSILRKAFSGQLVPQDPNDEPASVLLERVKAEKAAQDKAAKASRSNNSSKRRART